MSADWIIKQGDEQPIFEDQLTYSNGEAVNLTGEEVKFIMRAPTAAQQVTLSGTVGITGPKEGKVAFSPSATDSANAGNYLANWYVVGKKETFPTTGYLWVEVEPNLTATGNAQLVGLPEVKDHCNIKEEDHILDAKLVRFIKAAQPLIENLTGPIAHNVYDEWYEGGHATLALRHAPTYGYGTSPFLKILAASEYRGPIEYVLAAAPTPTQGSVYSQMVHPELQVVARRTSGGGTYPFWRDPNHPQQSVHVVYAAGQETTPDNVAFAMLETIKWWWDTTRGVGAGRRTQADLEVQGRPLVALPYHAEAMLAPTRRPPAFA